MKKLFYVFLIFISLGILVACSNEGGKTEKEFTIAYNADSKYVVENLKEKAKSGELIEFSVKSTSLFYTITEVKINDETLDANIEEYSFTMPNENVDIEIKTTEVAESANDNIDFSADTPTTISKAEEGSTELSIQQELVIEFNDEVSRYITEVNEEILIQNENVIPANAITYENITASSSNVVKGGKLTIDLEKVEVGETLIYINLKPNNGTLGTMIKKIKVVEYGQIELETMPATMNFDNRSSSNTKDIFINIVDQEYVYGSNVQEIITINLKDLSDGKYEFKYAVGHTYAIYCGDIDGNDISLTDRLGSGSSATGFNQFIDNILTLVTPSVEVELTILN